MKALLDKIRPYLSEIVNGSFILFGLAIAWMLTPDGSSRDTIGTILAVLSVLWALSMPIRLGGKD